MKILNREIKTAYFIGIKGVGMTMLAQFLSAQGVRVSGSDIPETFMSDKILAKLGIKVCQGFDVQNINLRADLIVYSGAYSVSNNIELKYLAGLKRKSAIVLEYKAALANVFNTYDGVAICGSHGKTTVTAWLGYVLARAGVFPNVLVGANVPQFQGSGLSGSSKLFIAEADEYLNKLKLMQPKFVVLNNIDYDHPDFFKTKASYFKAFADFVKKVPVSGFVVYNRLDPLAVKAVKNINALKIGIGVFDHKIIAGDCLNISACHRRISLGYQYFSVMLPDGRVEEFKIKLIGVHNVTNALAVIASALALGIDLATIKKHLATFRGTSRRMEHLGKFKGVEIYDDYAHHPTEVKALLAGVRENFRDKKIVAVFHPHTFSRTKKFFKEFSNSFKNVDELIILDIYGSAREKQGIVSSKDLAKAIKGCKRVINLKDLVIAEAYLRTHLKRNDLLLLIGAGDVFRIGNRLIK